MQFAGVLPEDAPDPRVETAARVRDLPFALMTLVPQPTLEDRGAIGFTEGMDAGGRSQLSASVGYTLWRNPDDRSDPANLAELDEQTKAALDAEPAWPRPAWLIEAVQAMRYPQLWDAVRTSWNRDASEYTTASRQLVDHANHILMNQFREELDIHPGETVFDTPWQVKESAVNAAASLEIDGIRGPALEIDTDPFVYAIGAQLTPDVVTTVVIAREHLPYVHVALNARANGV
jgi:hypothetical protein